MEILHKYAEDGNGKIIHINNALLGESYYCPECKEKFIFRKGKIRQQHFAHSNTSSNCTGEGYLHKTFKKMLLEIISDHINKRLPLNIDWNCNICKEKHNGNLVGGITVVKDEYNLETCRPDIALINEAGVVLIIIEIVHKHEPESNVIEYCKNNKTVLIRIKLDSLDDLENINNIIKSPTNVIFFDKMNCQNYVNYQNQLIQKQLLVNSMPIHNRIIQRGPRIDQVVAEHERKRKQQFAIRNRYKNKPRRK
jgi:predicted RNA-binding Zn-ribbon protein involved in translation (DUF1610 family)